MRRLYVGNYSISASLHAFSCYKQLFCLFSHTFTDFREHARTIRMVVVHCALYSINTLYSIKSLYFMQTSLFFVSRTV